MPGPCDLQQGLIHICEGSWLNGGRYNRLAVKYRTITRTNGPLRLTEIRQIMSPADVYTDHSDCELRQLKHSARFQINQADGRQGKSSAEALGKISSITANSIELIHQVCLNKIIQFNPPLIAANRLPNNTTK